MLDALYMFSAPVSGLLAAAVAAASVRHKLGAVASAAVGFVSGAVIWAAVGMLLLSTLR
jgi:hypothetical protein